MPLSLGVGFIVATVLVILTAGTAAAGLPFVIAGAALLGKGPLRATGATARPAGAGQQGARAALDHPG